MKTSRGWSKDDSGSRWASGALADALRRKGLDGVAALSDRRLGEPVEDRASSWVRRVTVDGFDCYVKTYDYPTPRARLRGALRNTFLAPSRAAREWSALEWLRRHGHGAPEPLARLELRRWGWLHRAVLVTRAWLGERLDHLLPRLAPEGAEELCRAVRRAVAAVHRDGFRHGNLDPRNVLARREADGSWSVAFLDAPRYRLRRPGERPDRDTAADWRRLGLQPRTRAARDPRAGAAAPPPARAARRSPGAGRAR